jgi:hemerythrin-like domain-containing protein
VGKATQDLRKEHDAILFVLQILDQMMVSDKDKEALLEYYDEIVYFLKIFADKCHHGKEENYLFKELVTRGIPNEDGPVGVMLREHALGRDFIAQMSRSHEQEDVDGFHHAARQYRDLLRSHIEKENGVLFPMADNVISEQEQEALFEQFERFEENVIGHGVHEKLHAMIDNWAKAFGIS